MISGNFMIFREFHDPRPIVECSISGNSADSRVQTLLAEHARFRKRERARDRGHVGEAGEHRGTRAMRPRHRPTREKVARNAHFQPYPWQPDSRVRFRVRRVRTLITSCARSDLTQDSSPYPARGRSSGILGYAPLPAPGSSQLL